MLGTNMRNVSAATGGSRPGPGGYVMQIVRVTNQPKNERIELEIDIAEGPFAGYYKDLSDRKQFWGAKFVKSYKESALPFFKSFIEIIQECNENTDGLVIGDFEDIDETKLVGKLFGMVYGMKEYIGNDGKTKEKPDWYNADYVSLDIIRNGEYEIPDLVPLGADGQQNPQQVGGVVDTTAGFEAMDPNDVPF